MIHKKSLHLVHFYCSFCGPLNTLIAVQLLWLNLVTNGIQGVALAFEAGEPARCVKNRENLKKEFFNDLMVKQTLTSGITIGIIAFAAWVWLLGEGYEENQARNPLLLLMVLFENFHVFNCRSEYRSAFRVPLRNNYFLIAGVILMQGLHIFAMHVPLTQELLSISPVSFKSWFSLFVIAGVIIVIMNTFKRIQATHNKDNPTEMSLKK